MNDLEPIIGLEIHLQLKTKSKMFCSCVNQGQEIGSGANTDVCPICLGHPGTLPTINAEAVTQGVRFSLALHAYINRHSKFDRKHYFYPDLPKGYQITQFDRPIATDGYLVLWFEGQKKRFGIERLHLEEDAGKNFHQGDKTLVDFNRAGTPLVEIVTKPDFRSPAEAKRFLQEIRLIARYLGCSDADMEKGHMRCDANVSLRPIGDPKFYPKTEVKNMNSFKAVERALSYEIQRQTGIWNVSGAPQEQTTRGWDESRGETVEQRSKEESNDYRYFPEPDLPHLELEQADVDLWHGSLPELPADKRSRFVTEYELSHGDVDVLLTDKDVADYFEQTVSELAAWLKSSGEAEGSEEEVWQKHRKKLSRLAFSWITTELYKHLNATGRSLSEVPVTAEDFAEFLIMLHQSKINSSAAQTIFSHMLEKGEDPHALAERLDLHQQSDEGSLEEIVQQIIAEQSDMASQYRNGKESLLQFFIGLGMKASKGKANPQVLAKLFKAALGE